MSKLQSKNIPARVIDVQAFQIEGDRIKVQTIVNKKDIDWDINRPEFEAFCDQNELREWEYDRAGNEGYPDYAVHGEYSWQEIYDGFEIMGEFIQKYITHLYDMQAMDIETPLKKILSSHKKIAI